VLMHRHFRPSKFPFGDTLGPKWTLTITLTLTLGLGYPLGGEVITRSRVKNDMILPLTERLWARFLVVLVLVLEILIII